MPNITRILIKTAAVAFALSALLAMIGGLVVGRQVTTDPIAPSMNGYRPLILTEVDAHETAFGIPFVLTVTFVRAPYDLRLKVIDQDLSTTRITVSRVEIVSSDASSSNETSSVTAAMTDYKHAYIDDHGAHQTKPAKMAMLTLPGCLPSTGEFTAHIVGTRLSASGESTEFSMHAKIRMRGETVFVTYRKLAAL